MLHQMHENYKGHRATNPDRYLIKMLKWTHAMGYVTSVLIFTDF